MKQRDVKGAGQDTARVSYYGWYHAPSTLPGTFQLLESHADVV
jgi:hypothetical protein